ncbi:Crp/Fnr family transcriptional regulator [Leucothrix arctica]|uniref:Crp/Fnr family transcriptional regulator n=1 Tax=Leucothrix arctica TaxID=1481894 RepID=A0A317C8H7_9GAMM|nr:Crp/Fnr family transcriptional regulator [Leucothrix arctica]PWQ93673.1 Crp/Fnr family transcriptional regulator [Leucothrix arctica]
MAKLQGKGNCQTCPIRYRSIFADIPEDKLPEVIGDFRTSILTLTHNEVIYSEGDAPTHTYTLRKGLIKLTKSLPDGRIQIVRIIGHGELFGFDGLANENHNHTALALTDIEICKLPMSGLERIRINNPSVDKAMMQGWIQGLRAAENMLLDLGAKKAPERLASFLLKWCKDTEQGQWIDLPLSRTEIAELLGLTVETVSRFLSDWKRKGYIEDTRSTVRLVDSDGLNQVVDGYSK